MYYATLNLPAISQEISLNANRLFRGLLQSETRIQQFASKMAQIGVGITLAVSIPLQVITGKVISTFASLEDAAFSAATRTGAATMKMVKDIERYSQTLSQRLPVSPLELTKGIESLLKAGMSLPMALMSVEKFTKFAYQANMTLDESVTRLVGTFSGLGMATGNAQRDLAGLTQVMDIVSKTADITLADMDSMTEAFSKAAPMAKINGIEIKQLAAILGTFHQANIRGAKAGTSFQMMIRDITKAATQNKPIWEKIFGKNPVYDAKGQLKPIADVIEMIQKHTSKMNPENARKLMDTLKIPSRSLAATAALFGLTDAARATYEQIKNVDGYVENQFQFRMKSLASEIKIATNRLYVMVFALGESLVPMVRSGLDWLQRLTNWFVKLSDAQRSTIAKTVMFGAVIGPVLILTASLIRAISTIANTFFYIKLGLGFLIGLFDITFNVVIAGAVLLAGWLIHVTVGWEKVGSAASSALSMIVSFLNTISFGLIDKALSKLHQLGEYMGILSQDPKNMIHSHLGYEIAKKNGTIGDAVYDPTSPYGKGMHDNFEKLYDRLTTDPKYTQGPNAEDYKKLAGSAIDFAERHQLIDDFEAKLKRDFLDMGQSSGLTASNPLTFGDEKMPNMKAQKSGPDHPFQAREYGSTEEYRERVSGQMQLVRSADMQVGYARQTATHTHEISRQVQQINHKISRGNRRRKEAPIK